MKRYLRSFVYNLASLWAALNLIDGVKFYGDYLTLLKASFVLTVINLIVRPLISLLLLPINLLTLGMFRWLANVIALYLVTLFVPQLVISDFQFLGANLQGFIIPQMHFSQFWALVLTSFFLSLFSSFLFWLSK